MWVRQPRLPHTHTHNLATHCAQAGRNTIGTWLCTRPRHRDCVDMPDAGLHPHREAMHKQHTHSQGHRAVCPSATHMSIRKHDRTTPSRNAATATQTHWCQPTMWRGHTRSTTSPKKGKGRGASAKSSVLRLTCVPLPHLVLPRRAHSTMTLAVCVCVCCLCLASRCGCRPASGMSTQSRCRGLVHSQVPMVLRPAWAQWAARLCVCVCVAIAVVGPTMVTPEGRGGLGG